MVKPQYAGAYQTNRRLVLRASDICWRCGRPGADTVDHITPVAHGGGHDFDNLAPAHRECNSRYGSQVRRQQPTVRRW